MNRYLRFIGKYPEFSENIPLTRERSGDRPAGGVAELRAAEAAVLPGLPVRSRVDRVWLIAGSDAPGSWHILSELPLAPG